MRAVTAEGHSDGLTLQPSAAAPTDVASGCRHRCGCQSGSRRSINHAMPEQLPALVLCDFPADTGHARWSSFSPFVVAVERALRLAKLPFRHDKVSMLRVRSLNPTGQLPVLLVGEEAVPDSTRIYQRIDALAPGALTRGLDARGIAEAWLWKEFADTALYPHALATRWADERG
jgi:glutathione S-transferase